MDVIVYLIPIALFLGLLGLVAFLWSLKSGQFEDMEGAAERILHDEDDAPDDDTAPPRPGAPGATTADGHRNVPN